MLQQIITNHQLINFQKFKKTWQIYRAGNAKYLD